MFKKKVFSSWDRFILPYPLTRSVFVWGKPLWVNPQAGESEIREKQIELEQALNSITAQADAEVLNQ